MEKEKSPYKGKTYKLKYPFEFGSEYIQELNIRRPKAKDIMHLKSKSDGSFEFEDMLKLIANVTDQPDPLIMNLDASDAIDLVTEVSDFLSGGQETGKS